MTDETVFPELPVGFDIPNHGLRVITFIYINWRGETGVRRILPHAFSFASTPWHPEPQWVLHALDLDRGEPRTFAMRDMKNVAYE